jgi:hypothetical protein
MTRPLSCILLQALRKLISACRGSVKAILFLWDVLKSLFRRVPGSGKRASGWRFEPVLDDANSKSVICASVQPQATQAVMSLMPPHESRPQTPNRPVSLHSSLHPHDFYSHNLNVTRSSYELGTTSRVRAASVHSLQPYEFSIHSASRSTQQDLGTLSFNSYALNNTSRISGLSRTSLDPRSKVPSRPPSSHSRSRHGNVAGVTPSASTPSVAGPCGNVAVPVANHPGLSSSDRIVFPIAPLWIERWDRNIKLYANNFVCNSAA